MDALWGQRETAWQQDLRKKRMDSLGGRFLLVGYVSRAELSRREDSREVDIVFSLTSYDLASGEVSDAQEFRLTGSGGGRAGSFREFAGQDGVLYRHAVPF